MRKLTPREVKVLNPNFVKHSFKNSTKKAILKSEYLINIQDRNSGELNKIRVRTPVRNIEMNFACDPNSSWEDFVL